MYHSDSYTYSGRQGRRGEGRGEGRGGGGRVGGGAGRGAVLTGGCEAGDLGPQGRARRWAGARRWGRAGGLGRRSWRSRARVAGVGVGPARLRHGCGSGASAWRMFPVRPRRERRAVGAPRVLRRRPSLVCPYARRARLVSSACCAGLASVCSATVGRRRVMKSLFFA